MRQPVPMPISETNDPATTIAVRGRNASIARTIAEIDLDNLTKEVQETGGTAIWWGVLYAHAQSDVGRAKLQVEVVEGQAAKAERLTRAKLGEKITDRIIEEETALNQDVIRAKEALIEAEERAAMLRSVVFAVEQKQRTLTALTGALAREMNANGVQATDDVLRHRNSRNYKPLS